MGAFYNFFFGFVIKTQKKYSIPKFSANLTAWISGVSSVIPKTTIFRRNTFKNIMLKDSHRNKDTSSVHAVHTRERQWCRETQQKWFRCKYEKSHHRSNEQKYRTFHITDYTRSNAVSFSFISLFSLLLFWWMNYFVSTLIRGIGKCYVSKWIEIVRVSHPDAIWHWTAFARKKNTEFGQVFVWFWIENGWGWGWGRIKALSVGTPITAKAAGGGIYIFFIFIFNIIFSLRNTPNVTTKKKRQ